MDVRQLGCAELIEAGFSRRDLFKMGFLTGAGDLVAKGCLSVRPDEQTQLRGGQSMIFMVPKFTGAAYFAATERGAKEAVAELKGRGHRLSLHGTERREYRRRDPHDR